MSKNNKKDSNDSNSNPMDLSTLSKKSIIDRAKKFSKQYCVGNGNDFRLEDYETKASFNLGPEGKSQVSETLEIGVNALSAMQDILYAQDKWSLLLIFQAMDAAGKDGAIKHVMSGVHPQGCQVFAFKAPTSEELDHDALWRTSKSLPERGRIGIFNRSYYEEVLVVRVHQAILDRQEAPPRLVTKRIWEERFEDIAVFERYLARQGYVILKFFIHVSQKAQDERVLPRL